jgi:hypothetical protein
VRNTAFVVMLLCLIRVAVPRIAQVDTDTVVGTITDSNGALSPRATVTATEMDPFITDGPGSAGVITSTVIPQRQIQFALKLEF